MNNNNPTDNQNNLNNYNNTEASPNNDFSAASLIAEQNLILEYNQNYNFMNLINLDEIISEDILIKEPDWKLLMFGWMTPKIRNLFFANSNYKKILTESNILFLEGLLYEHGLYGFEMSIEKAFGKYNEGIKHDNQYCLYRVFFILTNDKHCEKFKLKQCSQLALIFLIKSCAYNESYLDINRIEPIYKLNSILLQANKSLDYFNTIIENYQSYLRPYDLIKYGNEQSEAEEKSQNQIKKNFNPNSVLSIKIDELEVKYLNSFLLLSFPLNIKNLKDALQKLEEISQDHYEACFKLACIYYTPMYRDHIQKDIQKSLKFFEFLESKNYTRSLCSYYKVCEEQKIKDNLHTLILRAKNLRGYSSHFYANYLCRNRIDLEENKNKILKYFFKSMLFGNLISIVIVFEILTKLYISKFRRGINKIDTNDVIMNNLNSKKIFQKKKNKIKMCDDDKNFEIDIDYMETNSIHSDNENVYLDFSDEESQEILKYNLDNEAFWNYFFRNLGIKLRNFMELIYEFVSIQKNDENLNKTLDYDVLILFFQIHAYYHYKGYLVKQDYHKSIEIMEDTFKSGKSVKCYRKIFYYLAKSYKKIGNMEKFNFYMKKSFDIYILLSEFPYHHFIVGKTFLHGIHDIPKNLDYAIHYFKMGFNYNDNSFFINTLYSQKCHHYLIKTPEIVSYVNTTVLNSSRIIIDNFVDSENVCIICYANFRQVRHSKCKHKFVCLLCYEKMQNKNQCPFCKQISEAINEFEI